MPFGLALADVWRFMGSGIPWMFGSLSIFCPRGFVSGPVSPFCPGACIRRYALGLILFQKYLSFRTVFGVELFGFGLVSFLELSHLL